MRNHRPHRSPAVTQVAVTFFAVAAALTSGIAPEAGAEIASSPHRPTASFGFDLSTWTIDVPGLDRYTQIVAPMAYAMPLGEQLTLDVAARPFRSKISPAIGSSDAVSHFGDTQLRASYRLGRDLAMAVVSVGLPSGKSKLAAANELQNAAFAADRRLQNPVTNFGTGLVVNGSLAMARPFGRWALGAGVGYSFRAEYDLADSVTSYDPGDEINLTFGLDRNFKLGGRPAQLTGDVVYTLYSEDTQSGATLFEVGDKLFIEGRGLVSTGLVDPWILSVRFRSRADSEFFSAASPDSAQSIETGNEVETQITARFPAGDDLSFDVSALVRLFGDVDGAGGATLFGVGFGVRSRLGPAIVLQPAVLFQFGDVDDVNVTGIRVQAGVTIRP